MDNKVKVLRHVKYVISRINYKVNVVMCIIIAQALVVISLLVILLAK